MGSPYRRCAHASSGCKLRHGAGRPFAVAAAIVKNSTSVIAGCISADGRGWIVDEFLLMGCKRDFCLVLPLPRLASKGLQGLLNHFGMCAEVLFDDPVHGLCNDRIEVRCEHQSGNVDAGDRWGEHGGSLR